MKEFKFKPRATNDLERKVKRVELDPINIYNLEGSLDSFIETFNKIKENCAKDGLEVVRIEAYTQYEDEEVYAELIISGSRLENDLEYDERIRKIGRQQLIEHIEKENISKNDKKLIFEIKDESKSKKKK